MPRRYTPPSMFRRSKIIATVGPASRDPKTLRRLLSAGADAFRLNLSHGSSQDHEELIREIFEPEVPERLTLEHF